MEILDDKGNTTLILYSDDKATVIYDGKELDLYWYTQDVEGGTYLWGSRTENKVNVIRSVGSSGARWIAEVVDGKGVLIYG